MEVSTVSVWKAKWRMMKLKNGHTIFDYSISIYTESGPTTVWPTFRTLHTQFR